MDRTRRSRTSRPALHALALLACGALVLSACGGDDSSSEASATTEAATATTNPPVRHHELTPEEIETYQTDLDAVGCWAGPVDGVLGPRTEGDLARGSGLRKWGGPPGRFSKGRMDATCGLLERNMGSGKVRV